MRFRKGGPLQTNGDGRASSVSPHGLPQRSPTRLWVLRRRGTMPTRHGLAGISHRLEPAARHTAGLPCASIQQNHLISKASGCPCTHRRVWWRPGSPARRFSSQLCKANPHWPPPHALRWKAAIKSTLCTHQSTTMFGPPLPMGRKGTRYERVGDPWHPRRLRVVYFFLVRRAFRRVSGDAPSDCFCGDDHVRLCFVAMRQPGCSGVFCHHFRSLSSSHAQNLSIP